MLEVSFDLDQRVPHAILDCAFLKRGGFQVFEGFPSKQTQNDLLLEAYQQLDTSAHENNVLDPDFEEFRGGNPPRSFLSASGGAHQDAFYHSASTHRILKSIIGFDVNPTGQRGTYSYYSRAGDYLDIHRDIHTCDVAVITCLNDFSTGVPGGILCLYPDRFQERLSNIRLTPDKNVFGIHLVRGQSIILFGGIIPHKITPISVNQNRIVSVLCFRLI